MQKAVTENKEMMNAWWDMTENEIAFNKRKPENKPIVKSGIVSFIESKEDFMDYYDFVMEPHVSAIDDDVDCIIECGSGWGRNIFYLINKLKRKDIDYYALEYTRSGNNLCNMVKSMVPEYKVYSDFFDLNNPSIHLQKKYKKILVFTRHSIEQVVNLNNSFLNYLLSMNNLYKVIHQEPIGYQIDNKKELNQEDRKLSSNKNEHNNNFYSIVKRFEKDGKIKIEGIEIDHCIFGGLRNSATLIVWSPTSETN